MRERVGPFTMQNICSSCKHTVKAHSKTKMAVHCFFPFYIVLFCDLGEFNGLSCQNFLVSVARLTSQRAKLPSIFCAITSLRKINPNWVTILEVWDVSYIKNPFDIAVETTVKKNIKYVS